MLNELTPGRIFGTNIPQVSRFWVNQPKVQGLADSKLTVLSVIHPQELVIHTQTVLAQIRPTSGPCETHAGQMWAGSGPTLLAVWVLNLFQKAIFKTMINYSRISLLLS